MDPWQAEIELHRIYQEARSHRNSYFEKLAILDGGTVALVITAVLGPLHGTLKHNHLLGVGLTFLVVAMLTLVGRNFLAAHYESHAAEITASRDPRGTSNSTRRLGKNIFYIEFTGLLLSIIGIVFLLVEVWLILI